VPIPQPQFYRGFIRYPTQKCENGAAKRDSVETTNHKTAFLGWFCGTTESAGQTTQVPVNEQSTPKFKVKLLPILGLYYVTHPVHGFLFKSCSISSIFVMYCILYYWQF